jgi:hypothetical protein
MEAKSAPSLRLSHCTSRLMDWPTRMAVLGSTDLSCWMASASGMPCWSMTSLVRLVSAER